MLSQCRKWLNGRIFLVILITLLAGVGTYLVVTFIREFFGGSGSFHGSHYDFLAFYGAAHLTLHGQIAQIYNPTVMTQFQRTIVHHSVGANGYMPFLNPPFIAALLSPLALLSINDARVVWLILNLVLISGIAFWLVKSLYGKFSRILCATLLVCTFPVYQNLIEGQLSIIILAGCLLALWLARNQKLFLSGVALVTLLIKPQLAVLAAIGLMIFKQWRALLGSVGVTVALIAVTLPVTRLKVYGTYVHYILGVTGGHFNGAGAVASSVWQGSLKLTFGINGMYTALLGQANVSGVNILTGLTILGLLILYVLAVRKVQPGFNSLPKRLMLVASIALVMLIDPHAFSQDFVLAYLFLPVLLSLRPRLMTILVYLVFIELIIIDQLVFLHLVTIVLIGLTVCILIDVIKGHDSRSSIFHWLPIRAVLDKL
jgi:hypothetical protein